MALQEMDDGSGGCSNFSSSSIIFTTPLICPQASNHKHHKLVIFVMRLIICILTENLTFKTVVSVITQCSSEKKRSI